MGRRIFSILKNEVFVDTWDPILISTRGKRFLYHVYGLNKLTHKMRQNLHYIRIATVVIRVLASTRWAQNEEKYENLPSTIIYELAHLKNRRFLRSCDVILRAIKLKLNIIHYCIMPQKFWKFYLFMLIRLWVIARNVQKTAIFSWKYTTFCTSFYHILCVRQLSIYTC